MSTKIQHNPWRIVEWTNETGGHVKSVACHEDELEEVINLPMPAGAVVRQPVMRMTSVPREWIWFRRVFGCDNVGDNWFENINQGDRYCKIEAVDHARGDFLYSYEMPGGRVFLRNKRRRPVSARRLSRRWRKLLGLAEGEEYYPT